MKMYTMLTILLVCLLFASTASAIMAEPMEAIKGPINDVITILNDPVYKEPDLVEAQRDKIWETVRTIFDFEEMSKRTLARNWRSFSPAEKTEFTRVFSRFLGNTYMDKIQGEFHNEKIVFVSQEIAKEKYALVKTQIVRETLEIPVDYKLIKSNDQWKVYDVSVEGVSLVKNYRSQFEKILQKEKPAQLIEKLSEKLKNQD
ncbi:MAG: ABC transporter substrate-binding protein [Desulfobacteraceae bacterium]|nr:ABC transporter substrate-binding protein [Desulfobacteraceae bacterium]